MPLRRPRCRWPVQLRDGARVTVMEVSPTTMAIVPGVPLPLAAGPHFEALCASIQRNGPSGTVLMDADGVVWGGRTMWNACLEVGVQPRVAIVEDGWMAAVLEFATRDLSVLETADLVASIARRVADSATEGRLNVLVSDWIRRNLGKARGFSPRQVHHYLMLARLPAEERYVIAKAATVNEAMSLLSPERPRKSSTEPPDTHSKDLSYHIEKIAEVLEGDRLATETIESLLLLAKCIEAKLGIINIDAQDS